MDNNFKNAIRHTLTAAVFRYRQAVLCGKWAVCIAATMLVWGGAIWFGSLAWDQKQGAILALMGFGAWHAACRFVLPGFWYLSLDVIRYLFRYIHYRFM